MSQRYDYQPRILVTFLNNSSGQNDSCFEKKTTDSPQFASNISHQTFEISLLSHTLATKAVERGSRRLVTALLQLGARLSSDRHLGSAVSETKRVE